MSTLAKIARATLDPVEPGGGTTTPGRVYVVKTQVPIYREYTLPISQARPGDRIVKGNSTVTETKADGTVVRKIVYSEYAIRTELVGYNTVSQTVVEPGKTTQPPAPKTNPVPPAWDATAWSVAALPAPLEATWQIGEFTASHGASGVLVGLTFLETAPGDERRRIIHGIRVEGGLAYVHNAVPAGVALPAGVGQVLVPVMSVAHGQTLKVTVTDSLVRFYVNDVLMAVQPSALGSQPVHLAAVLYDPRDTVEAAELKVLPLAGGAVALRLAARGSDTGYAEGSVRLRLRAAGEANKNRLRLRLFARGSSQVAGQGHARLRLGGTGFGNYLNTGSGAVTLGPILALGSDYAYAAGSAALVLRCAGDGASPSTKLMPRVVTGGQFMESAAPFQNRNLVAQSLAGGSFEATIRRNEALRAPVRTAARFKASRVYLERLHNRMASSSMLRGARLLDVALMVQADIGVPLVSLLVVDAELDGAVGLAGQLAGMSLQEARLVGQVAAGVEWGAGAVLNAALDALVRAGDVVHLPGANLAVWSVNMETSGSTAYEQYPFNSFARIGGRFYGAAEGGVYELAGDTDDGAPIGSVMNLGKRNFGTDLIKGISNAYLTVSSEGHMHVRVTTPDGKAYTYATRRADDHMRTQRADFGRGLRAHYLGLELLNTDGADFQLESAEFLVLETKRRI